MEAELLPFAIGASQRDQEKGLVLTDDQFNGHCLQAAQTSHVVIHPRSGTEENIVQVP
jgi:hypothetical protein